MRGMARTLVSWFLVKISPYNNKVVTQMAFDIFNFTNGGYFSKVSFLLQFQTSPGYLVLIVITKRMDSSFTTVIAFLLFLSNFQQKIEAQFNRACESYEDCVFYNETLEVPSPFNDPSVSFVCDTEAGSCACRSAVVLTDNKPLWDLRWSMSEERNQAECQIGPNGPCGFDRGLHLHCAGRGLKCIDGRCRQETQLRKLGQGTLCHDSIECELGLVCQMTKWHYFYTESKCLPPTNHQEVIESHPVHSVVTGKLNSVNSNPWFLFENKFQSSTTVKCAVIVIFMLKFYLLLSNP